MACHLLPLHPPWVSSFSSKLRLETTEVPSKSPASSRTLMVAFSFRNLVAFYGMKKLQPDDEIIKIDEELGIAWIRLPPDNALGGFRGISPRIIDEKKFLSAKKKKK